MSQQNVERVRRGYDAWNRGEIEDLLESLHPDVEWLGHPQMPEPGPYRGREAVERWIREFRDVWGEVTATPVEFVDAGDHVIVLVRMAGRGRGSGAEVAGGTDVHVWSFIDAEICAFRIYQGGDAAERAGLSPLEMDALRLCVADELGEAEVADRLDLSAAQVAGLVADSLGKLRGLAPAQVAE